MVDSARARAAELVDKFILLHCQPDGIVLTQGAMFNLATLIVEAQDRAERALASCKANALEIRSVAKEQRHRADEAEAEVARLRDVEGLAWQTKVHAQAEEIAEARRAERLAAEKFYDQMARDYVKAAAAGQAEEIARLTHDPCGWNSLVDLRATVSLAHLHAEAMRAMPYDEFAAEEACAQFEEAYDKLGPPANRQRPGDSDGGGD